MLSAKFQLERVSKIRAPFSMRGLWGGELMDAVMLELSYSIVSSLSLDEARAHKSVMSAMHHHAVSRFLRKMSEW
jgi:hypothetical protein